MVQNITKKEYSLGDILSHSWALFTKNFKLILIIILIVYIPINIILAFIPIELLMTEYGLYRGFQLYLRIIQVLEGLIGIIATMAIAYAIDKILKKQKIDFKEALKKSLLRWPAAIGTNILMGIFLIGLFLLLIVPGIIYSVYWTFAIFAVILHNKSFKKALDHSKSVVKNKWWKVLGISLVLGILALFVGVIIGLIFLFVPEHFLINIISDTFVDVAGSFFTVAATVFFINLDHFKS